MPSSREVATSRSASSSESPAVGEDHHRLAALDLLLDDVLLAGLLRRIEAFGCQPVNGSPPWPRRPMREQPRSS